MATKQRMTKEDKKWEREVDGIAQRCVNGIPIPLLSILDIHKAGMDAARKGEDIEAAVKAAIEKVRVNY